MTAATDLSALFCRGVFMVRVLVSFLIVICLCGCDFEGVRITNDVKEYETDFASVKAEIISFSGFKNEEFEKSINSEIAGNIESDIVAFDMEAQENKDNVRMGNKCVLEIDWEEKYNNNDFISVVEEKYVYTGGAHGSTVRIPKNIDIATGKEIKLSDLFTDTGYENTLNRMINELVTENSEEYKDLWAKPEIKQSHQTDFYINDNKLVIFFQPYDLSYYARGFVEFPLDLGELSGYMKEEYRRIIE